MEIKLKEITIRELTNGYQDNAENGVRGYGGLLDIRPPYQREFVYNDKQRDAVIDTVMKKFPLNVMYWAVRDDGTYEVNSAPFPSASTWRATSLIPKRGMPSTTCWSMSKRSSWTIV